MLERIPLRPLPALAAALVVLAAGFMSGGGPLPADAGEGGPLPSPFIGENGAIRMLYAPEFQEAVSLIDDLATFGIEGLDAQLVGPLVAAPEEGQPPVPSRLLLTGQPEVIGQAREVLGYFDIPKPSVVVSLLVAEVRSKHESERGGSILFDRAHVPGAPDSIFRGALGSYEPESYLRSSLTGALPFEGTSLHLGNGSDDWTQNGLFEFVLRMLQTERSAEFLAWPTVVCTEGVPGVIENVVLRPDRVVALAGSAIVTRARTVTGGIILTVIPVHISRAGAVLDLVADIGILVPEDPSDLAASGWIQTRRRVATRVTVHDRESLLIGGLKMRRHLKDGAQDPIIGQVPGARYLASSEEKSCVETEMILLLRARVRVPSSAVGVTLPPGEARRLQKQEDGRGRTPAVPCRQSR